MQIQIGLAAAPLLLQHPVQPLDISQGNQKSLLRLLIRTLLRWWFLWLFIVAVLGTDELLEFCLGGLVHLQLGQELLFFLRVFDVLYAITRLFGQHLRTRPSRMWTEDVRDILWHLLTRLQASHELAQLLGGHQPNCGIRDSCNRHDGLLVNVQFPFQIRIKVPQLLFLFLERVIDSGTLVAHIIHELVQNYLPAGPILLQCSL